MRAKASRDAAQMWDEGSWSKGQSAAATKPGTQVRRRQGFRLRPQFVATILITVMAFSGGLAVGPYVASYQPGLIQESVTVTQPVTLTVTIVSTTCDTQIDGKWLASGASVVSYLEAANYVGQSKTVEGKIVRTYVSSKGTVFLDFHDPYQGYFVAVIFQSDVGNFPFSPASFYLNKEVRVTGTIQIYEGAPEIIVHSPSQIEVAYMGFNYP